MTHVAIPTLHPDIRLEIQNLGSSDIRFGVDSNSCALARIGNSSIFSSYKADRHLQSFFMEMMKSEEMTFPGQIKVTVIRAYEAVSTAS